MIDGFVTTEDMELFEQVLKKFPVFRDLKISVLEKMSIDEVHPLFWEITNEKTNGYFAVGLDKILKEKRRTIIAKLKNKEETLDIVRQIFVYNRLRNDSQNEVSWEPSGMNYDIGLSWKEKKIEIEVFCLNESDIDKKQDEIRNQIKTAINGMKDNPFLVNLHIFEEINDFDVNNFCVKLQNFIVQKLKISEEEFIFNYPSDEKKTITVRLLRNELGEDGFFATSLFPNFGLRKISIRAQNRLCEKLKKFQFSKNKGSLHGFVIITGDRRIHPDSIVDGILGTKTFVIDHGKTEVLRKRNGAIHLFDVGEIITEKIDFVVVIEGSDLSKNEDIDGCVFVNEKRRQITEDSVMQLLRISKNISF